MCHVASPFRGKHESQNYAVSLNLLFSDSAENYVMLLVVVLSYSFYLDKLSFDLIC